MHSVLETLGSDLVLCGKIRDHVTALCRPSMRFFACKEDVSLEPLDAPLPEPVMSGRHPFHLIGAMANG